MSVRRAFVDSNVILYLMSDDVAKAERARTLFYDDSLALTISTQVVGEVVNVARRKSPESWARLRRLVDWLHRSTEILTVSLDDQRRAFDVAEATGYSWWDSQLLAVAARAGAEIVYTEDLQHGRVVGPLAIVDPFRA